MRAAPHIKLNPAKTLKELRLCSTTTTTTTSTCYHHTTTLQQLRHAPVSLFTLSLLHQASQIVIARCRWSSSMLSSLALLQPLD
eukprot:5315177-Amphidinium_carterae.4